MARKRFKPEEIVAKLRQVDVLTSQGQSTVEAIRQIGVSEVTYYRWRQEFGGLKIEQVKRLKELETENGRLRRAIADFNPGQADSSGGEPGKLLGPARRRVCIEHVCDRLQVSERRACAALGQHRSTQRKLPQGRADAERLTADVVELARQYGRYGYRKIAALLRQAGWVVSDGRVERLWRREGLKSHTSSPSERGCGSPTVPASGCGQSDPITSGLTTFWRTEPMTGGDIACSMSLTSSRTSVWQSGSIASSGPSM